MKPSKTETIIALILALLAGYLIFRYGQAENFGPIFIAGMIACYVLSVAWRFARGAK